MRAAASIASFALACACGAKSAPNAAVPASSSSVASVAPASSPAPRDVGVRIENAPPPRLTPIDQPTYDRAKSLAKSGRLRAAKRLFAKLLVAYPNEPALLNDFNDTEGRIAANESAAKRSLEGLQLRALPPPPFDYALRHPARVSGAPVPKLTLAAKKKNQITDDEQWFASTAGGLHRPEWFVPPANDFFFVRGVVQLGQVRAVFSGFLYADVTPSQRFLPEDIPEWLPASYGTLPITHAIRSTPMSLAIYGDRVLAVFDGAQKARGLFDFTSYMVPSRSVAGKVKVGEGTVATPDATARFDINVPTQSIVHELRWAAATEQTLFVEHTNREYAKENKGQNAYISALDLDSGDLAWRSAPLVCNAESFALSPEGSAIVAGYGFTAEPDFVYVLDAATGAIKQKIPVPSGPDDIIAKDGRYFVRTYDHDLVFDAK